MERFGMTVTVRDVDDSQYENSALKWDYDRIVGSWAESLSPGNEQREFWGSKAPDDVGSRNLIGIKNPAVDKLIDRVIFAKNREELLDATRDLHHLLLSNNYIVPNCTSALSYTNRCDR